MSFFYDPFSASVLPSLPIPGASAQQSSLASRAKWCHFSIESSVPQMCHSGSFPWEGLFLTGLLCETCSVHITDGFSLERGCSEGHQVTLFTHLLNSQNDSTNSQLWLMWISGRFKFICQRADLAFEVIFSTGWYGYNGMHYSSQVSGLSPASSPSWAWVQVYLWSLLYPLLGVWFEGQAGLASQFCLLTRRAMSCGLSEFWIAFYIFWMKCISVSQWVPSLYDGTHEAWYFWEPVLLLMVVPQTNSIHTAHQLTKSTCIHAWVDGLVWSIAIRANKI